MSRQRDRQGKKAKAWGVTVAPALAFRAAALLLGLAMPLWAQADGQELEGKPVTRISFVGLSKLTPDAVKALMGTKEGARFSRDVLDADVKRLAGYTTYRGPEDPKKPSKQPIYRQLAEKGDELPIVPKVFSIIPSVLAEWDAASSGVLVTINAEENRRVVGLVFIGAYHLEREELLPLMRTRTGSLVDDFTLELDRQELLRHYREKGYHYAEVDFQINTEKLGNLVVFKITEGDEVTIRSVTFEGVESFSKDELLKEMPFMEEPGFLSSKEFVLDQVLRDVVQLVDFYRNHGFRDAQATLLDARPTPDHEEVDLLISVEEGKPYFVRSIQLKGVTLFDPAEFQAELKTLVGARYEPGYDLQRDLDVIERRYQAIGHTEVKVENDSTFGLDQNEVDVVITVTEGDLVYVGDIIIRGNQETQDRIIRREILVNTGEPMDLQRLMKSKQRIRRLQYWEVDGVQQLTPAIPVQEFGIYRDAYSSLRDTKRENVKDVIFDVRETDTGSLRFAAGIGSNSGFLGDITYTKTNFDPTDFPEDLGDVFDAFTGGGQFVALSFQPGTIFTRWRAAWGNSRIFDSPYLVVGEAYLNTAIREDWDEERIGGSIRVGRELSEDLRADLTFRDELVEVEDIDGDAPQLVFDFEGENELTTISLDLRLNKLEFQPYNLIDPIDGFLLQLSLEHAGLWGDIEYNKAVLAGEKYIHLLQDDAERDHVFQLKGSLGVGSEYGDTRDIPVYERFYAGGAGTIRGFRFRGVGPRENDSPIGGKALWTAGAEYAYPVIGNAIRGVAFLDAGSVAEDWGSDDITNVRLGGGVGLRVVIPFLGDRPVAIDFGIPIVKDGDDETQLISFSFGKNF